jgi:two-component system cell cycle response regulator DivK
MPQIQALIIDDNSDNLSVLTQLLNDEGVNCTQINHPAAIQTLLETAPTFNVIFLDLEMPQLNGFEVRDILKNHPRQQHVPIVAYSVHVSEIHVTREYGFDGFLGKPLDADQFPQQLAKILNGQAVWSRGG